MAHPRKHQRGKNGSHAVMAVLASVLVLVFAAPSAQAQTYSIIHTFSGPDGATPLAGLSMDFAGNLYGTTSAGGAGYGTVFKLRYRGAGWTLNTLYSFQSGTDGATPSARVIFGPDGTLYGTTPAGGNTCDTNGCGTVFNLRPAPTRPTSTFSPWLETILRRFTLTDGAGAYPYGEVLFDAAGNLYGTAQYGGGYLDCDGPGCGTCDPICGTVFELSPSNGGWTYSKVYHFTQYDYSGAVPKSPLAFDHAGNLYGTNSTGDECGFGNLFELTPTYPGWTGQTLHTFCGYQGDGANPLAGLIPDSAGNFYGATPGALGGYGTQLGSIYKLTPSGSGGWNFSVLLNFPYGMGPGANLVMGADGNLYGTTTYGGNYNDCTHGCGTVFMMTPSGVLTDLHDFTGNDGSYPYSNLVFDGSGNLYGTTSTGGQFGDGVVFKIAP